ncbi:MAG: serine acetyltransferase [Clostridia bacterium]|nr:serine acetyltransferase [Clostridia bacterium]
MLTDKIQSAVSRAALSLQEEGTDSPIRPEFRKRILCFLSLVRAAMYPKIFGGEDGVDVEKNLREAGEQLARLLDEVLDAERHEEVLCRFFEGLPTVKEMLATDVQAAYEGDPAARSNEEIMLTYPTFEAISIYRLAHLLYTLGVPLLPRMMTEHAHRQTGVDIHPGATIGRYFFIDHATGVVVGETCTIGDHVKLYQGVTLGAKSFELDEDGNPVKGIKRHPDIGNHVVIYANATILGGNTVVGDGCVIGGSVWLTHSLPAGSTVYYNGGDQNKIV